jgi:hypothetical protein
MVWHPNLRAVDAPSHLIWSTRTATRQKRSSAADRPLSQWLVTPLVKLPRQPLRVFRSSHLSQRLSSSGIRIAIDDFGTGYSSLNYLRRFNFHSLKVDRSFISNVIGDRKTAAVTEGLFALAQSLNLKVTAEGVETREQLAFLLSRQCDQFQGYLVSRPVPAQAIYHLLEGGYNLGNSLRLTPLQQSGVVTELHKALKCRTIGHLPAVAPRTHDHDHAMRP